MELLSINENIRFENRFSLIKGFLYLKLLNKDQVLPENDLNVLTLFVTDNDKASVIQKALKEEFVKSEQSGENTVSKLVKLKLLEKQGLKLRMVSKELVPKVSENNILISLKMFNLDAEL